MQYREPPFVVLERGIIQSHDLRQDTPINQLDQHGWVRLLEFWLGKSNPFSTWFDTENNEASVRVRERKSRLNDSVFRT